MLHVFINSISASCVMVNPLQDYKFLKKLNEANGGERHGWHDLACLHSPTTNN